MADNTLLNAGTGGDLIATDDIGGGVKVQRVKIITGADGVNEGDVSSAHGLPVRPGNKTVSNILNAVTSNQTSAAIAVGGAPKTIQAILTGTGAISATVAVYASHNNSTSNGVPLCTFSLAGTTAVTDGTYVMADWPYLYAILTGLSGTAATVTLSVGY